MKKTKVTRKDVLFISVSMFIIVALWVGFSIYHSWATSTISESLQTQIIPIAPNFDTQTLNNLKSRERIEPLFETVVEVTTTPIASTSPTVSPENQTLQEEILIPTEEPTPTL